MAWVHMRRLQIVLQQPPHCLPEVAARQSGLPVRSWPRKYNSGFSVADSVVDPDPYWIRIQELPGSGSGSTHANIG